MGFTVELNIGAIATPVAGGGWVVMAPDIKDTKVKLGRGDTDILERIQTEGGITFLSDEYIALKELKDDGNLLVEYRIKFDSVIQITGEMPLFGEWETGEKSVKLTTKPADLIGILKAELSTEVIPQLEYVTNNGLISTTFDTSLRNRYTAIELASGLSKLTFNLYAANGSITPAGWVTATDYTKATRAPTNQWWSASQLPFITEGLFNYICIKSHTSDATNKPESGVNWNTYWERAETVFRDTQEYAGLEFSGATWVEQPEIITQFTTHWDEWQKADTTAQIGVVLVVSGNYRLFDMLEALLGNIDSSIEIYENTAGDDTGFCEYIEDNFPNKLDLRVKFYEDKPKLSLQDIIEIYENMFNCKWTLEGNIFVFRHESERPSLLGSDPIHDLTTYESRDWTVYIFTDEPQNYKKETWEFGDHRTEDFVKAEIDYGTPYEEILSRNIDIVTDLAASIIDEKGILLTAAPSNVIYNVTGLISGEVSYNGSLSPVQCVSDHFQEGRLFETYESWTGGTVLSLTVRRMKIVELETPINDLTGITLRDWLFRTNLAFLEVSEIVVSLHGDIAKFKAVY